QPERRIGSGKPRKAESVVEALEIGVPARHFGTVAVEDRESAGVVLDHEADHADEVADIAEVALALAPRTERRPATRGETRDVWRAPLLRERPVDQRRPDPDDREIVGRQLVADGLGD